MPGFIIQSAGLVFSDYLIPPFEFRRGEILHVWVPMVPKPKVSSGEELPEEFSRIFRRKYFLDGLEVDSNEPIAHNPNLNKLGFWGRFFPLTVEGYLKKKGMFTGSVVNQLTHYLDIKLTSKIGRLDLLSRKILSILDGLNRGEIVIYDYFGLGPQSTGLLDKFLYEVIDANRAAIGFDNLHYLPPMESFEKFNRVVITSQ